ncbi:hypothetical protein A2634_01600 [Candidatus Amesbacteria bacterium RIFCSPHIGHO2_01_FULL_48_32]|uniref:Probable transcriptional regulatory protein A2989_03585 n=1 Tax=Candidatus Amesbacteria bacterium RIFCSPLOWO2_01_FULL_48_25 TaxID=1797259 RepID=A0A1F4ZCS8_9BACT|nr:MAG: hypothetical protein A2634_01600 [Candidatus Amesbacteria bacterium RIFCSPHIGHO2_01_FULL_48_32]OGD03736.1 MAG: hypothetical protein A2989_03585 [Candidatus Amesbacteria bacterium RIFCSPLOWO2_01_FULL_48_25]HJZ05915.1 YebC/PmpR family DNA-binding transcriptional regulator [Patescibacteria group bacterium]
MSGHSKWATIHRQKEIKDAKRGAIFTKLAANITVAVKSGGGIADPSQNFRLRLAIDKAKQFNMPKENVNRAIEKGMGGVLENTLTEVVYEGFAPGGVAVMIEVLTDNKLRAAQAVREVFDKNGGTMGSSGAVAYLFSQKGEIRIKNKELKDEDELRIIDLAVSEIVRGEDEWMIYCHPDQTFVIRDRLAGMGCEVVGAELVRLPETTVLVSDPGARVKIEKILEMLSELDDVQKVWTNYA